MSTLIIEKADYDELQEVYLFAKKFDHVDNFYSILHTGITYVIKCDNIIVGISSLLRQDNHWNFTMFNFDLLQNFQTEHNYHLILEYILKDIKHNGGYTVEILNSIANQTFSHALITKGFTESSNGIYDVYTINQSILF